MSKSLIKLLDNSLLPASLMIVSKFVGIVVIIQLLNIEWSIRETPNNIFSFQTVLSTENVLQVTSYSDLLMYLILALGFSVNIFRAVFLHNSHISFEFVSKLASNNLMSLIKNSYEIYHSASIWLVFMWVATLIIIGNVFSGSVYQWVGLASILTSVLLTIVFLQDVYKEIEYVKKHPAEYLN